MSASITGFGIIGPGFNNVQEFKTILTSGKCVLNLQSIHDLLLHVGQVNEADIEIGKSKYIKKYPKTIKMLLHSCQKAIEMANLDVSEMRVAVIIGSSGSLLSNIINYSRSTVSKKKVSPFMIGNMNSNSLSSAVSSYFNLHGISFTLSNSCTSGLDALHFAKILIETNQVDACIVGGVDSTLSELIIRGFHVHGLLSIDSGKNVPSGPFSNGEGFHLSEGAGVVILENDTSCSKREAKIWGRLTSISLTQDGISAYQSDDSGTYMLKAVDDCIQSVMPSYINSQALGIKQNDDIESKVYEQRFLNSAIPITSIKGMVGHAMAASGMFQLIASIISMENSFIPPTIHSKREFYPHLPINEHYLEKIIKSVLITAHGYGGNNSCALISKGD